MVLATLALPVTSQGADAYPVKPIIIVYPYAGGSASDALTHQVGEILSQAVGQPVVVDSKPDAGGSMTLEHASRVPADGYTLVLTASGTMAVNPHIYNLKYKPVDDLASITTLVDIPFVVVTRNSFPARNLKEFIAYAKANPAKVVFANAGMGTQARIAYLPAVPAADEAGLPGFVTSGWFGLAAPKGTPQSVIEKLNAIITKAFGQPDIRKKLLEAGWIPVANSSSNSDARARADLLRFGAIAQQLNLKPNQPTATADSGSAGAGRSFANGA